MDLSKHVLTSDRGWVLCWGSQSVNLLCALETVALLLAGGPNAKPGKDANVVANQTLFAQVYSSFLTTFEQD